MGNRWFAPLSPQLAYPLERDEFNKQYDDLARYLSVHDNVVKGQKIKPATEGRMETKEEGRKRVERGVAQ